jgi:hypothetical protein
MNKSGYSTEHFYKEVITKVLDQSRDYFLQANINEDVLAELKKVLNYLNIFYILSSYY